jgi:hypothetical protein
LMEKSSPLLSSCTPTVFLSAAAAFPPAHKHTDTATARHRAGTRSRGRARLAISQVRHSQLPQEGIAWVHYETLLLAKIAKELKWPIVSLHWFVTPLAAAAVSQRTDLLASSLRSSDLHRVARFRSPSVTRVVPVTCMRHCWMAPTGRWCCDRLDHHQLRTLARAAVLTFFHERFWNGEGAKNCCMLGL